MEPNTLREHGPTSSSFLAPIGLSIEFEGTGVDAVPLAAGSARAVAEDVAEVAVTGPAPRDGFRAEPGLAAMGQAAVEGKGSSAGST